MLIACRNGQSREKPISIRRSMKISDELFVSSCSWIRSRLENRMPKKPLHPTVYPKMSGVDALSAIAAIFASGAVRAATQGEFRGVLEPEFEHNYVQHETSVKHSKTEVLLKTSVDDALHSQPSLFDEMK